MTFINEKPFEHQGSHGTILKASRCDFKEGVLIERPNYLTEAKYAQDLAEIFMFHSINIFPLLNGFSSFAVKVEMVD